MSAVLVSDSLSNGPEHIKAAAQVLANAPQKIAVFTAIYYHKKSPKTAGEISIFTNLPETRVLQIGGELKNRGLVTQEKKDGRTAYGQISFFQANKKTILKFAKNPKKLKEIATKREPTIRSSPVSLNQKLNRRQGLGKRAFKTDTKPLKIAFLLTNPENNLRTDVEIREVQKAIRQSTYRDQIEASAALAASPNDVMASLNQFLPTVVHFSGHAGGETLLLDSGSAFQTGGVEFGYDHLRRAIGAVDSPPRMLILNGCNTLSGAEVFLEIVDIVIVNSRKIFDNEATAFSAAFYKALFEAQSVASAFDQACLSIDIERVGDSSTPKILAREGINTKDYRFVRRI